MATKVINPPYIIPKLQTLTDTELKAIDKLSRKLFEKVDVDNWQSVLAAQDAYKTCNTKFEDLTRWFNRAQGQLQELQSRVDEIQKALQSSAKKTGLEERASDLKQKVTVIEPKAIDPSDLSSLDWYLSTRSLEPENPELYPLNIALCNNDAKLLELQAIYDASSAVLKTATPEVALLEQQLTAQPGAAKKARVNE
jgi:hypothetical protein